MNLRKLSKKAEIKKLGKITKEAVILIGFFVLIILLVYISDFMTIGITGYGILNESFGIQPVNESLENLNESSIPEIIENFSMPVIVPDNLSFPENLTELIIIPDNLSNVSIPKVNESNITFPEIVENISLVEDVKVIDRQGKNVNFTLRKLGRVRSLVFEETINRLEFNNLENGTIKLDEIKGVISPKNAVFRKVFAIELNEINFSSGYLYANASFQLLYDCRNFDFEIGICLGKWEKIKNLEIGKEYSAELGKGGFAEGYEIINEILVSLRDKDGKKIKERKVSISEADVDFAEKKVFGISKVEDNIKIENIKSNLSEINIFIDESNDSLVKTSVIAINESFEFDNATIRLVKNGEVNKIIYCENFDLVNFSCGNWKKAELNFSELGGSIEFVVEKFSAYAGGFEVGGYSIQAVSYCGGSYTGGNWTITSNVVCGNETIHVNGSILIKNNGNLTLHNITINITGMTANGQYNITKSASGGLWILDNNRDGNGNDEDASWITSGSTPDSGFYYYDFYVFGNGKNDNFSLMHSKVTQAGYGTNSQGVYLKNVNNSVIYKNNISSGGKYGFYLVTSGFNNVSSNLIGTPYLTGYGIYLDTSSNSNTLQSNTITTKGTSGYGIYLYTSSNSNTLQSNTITTTGSSGYGIYLDTSSNSNTLQSNTITTTGSSGHGIVLVLSSNSNITSNTIITTGTSGSGIVLNTISNSNTLQSNTITTNGSSSWGIDLYSSSKNNATKNKINATGSNADGVFIRRDSDNNIIYKNNITESGRDGVNIDPSGANKPTNNNITKNRIFNSTKDGIAVSHSDNIIEYNLINRSRQYGINVSHKDINITGNIIYNSTSYGIYVNSSNTLILRNTIRNTTGAGIYIWWKAKNTRIILNNITRNFVGVNITNATGINLTNNSFIGNTIYDIELSATSSAISLNNSLNKKKVKVNASGGKYSNLSMKWFLYVNVSDNKTNPSGLNNVNVTIYDNSTGNLNAIMLSRQTNSRGRTALFEIKEYIQNSSGNLTTYMPVNVSGIGNASYYANRTKKFFGRSLPLFSLTLGTKSPTVLGSYCSGNYVDYDGSVDNWNINTNIVCGNETIPVDGNISVNSGGNLTLYNVTINFSMLKNGSNFINKTEQGGLWVFDNFRNGTGDEGDASWITGNDSELYYDFYVFGKGKNGNFSLMHSKVTQAGYLTKSQGIYLKKVNNSVIYKNNISNGARYGLYLDRSGQNNISKNFVNTTGSSGYGIYLYDRSDSNILQSNTITTKGSDGYGIWLDTDSNSNITSNTITTKGEDGIGIYILGSSNSNITSNTITTTGSSGYGIYLLTSSNSNTLQSNTITTKGSFGYGIIIELSSNSNTLQSNTITTNGSRGYGIIFSTVSNNNATKNKINATGSNADGVFIYDNSDNNIIYKNNITEAGRYGVNIDPSGASKPTNNNITKNRIFNSTKDGIAVSEQKNIIEYNIINRSRNYGINVSHQKVNITGNIIYNSTSYGIYVNSSNTLILRNTIRNTTAAGIYLGWKSKNTRVILNNITRNFIGVNITNATGINLTNNSFIGNTIYDIELSATSSAISLNNSLNKKKVKVFASGGKYSNLTMKWFIQPKAIDENSNVLNNINITVYYNSSTPAAQFWTALFSENTSSSGVTNLREFTEFIQNKSGNDSDYMPLKFTGIDAQDYNANSSAIESFGRSWPVYNILLTTKICGNGVCNSNENCESCPTDCGRCSGGGGAGGGDGGEGGEEGGEGGEEGGEEGEEAKEEKPTEIEVPLEEIFENILKGLLEGISFEKTPIAGSVNGSCIILDIGGNKLDTCIKDKKPKFELNLEIPEKEKHVEIPIKEKNYITLLVVGIIILSLLSLLMLRWLKLLRRKELMERPEIKEVSVVENEIREFNFLLRRLYQEINDNRIKRALKCYSALLLLYNELVKRTKDKNLYEVMLRVYERVSKAKKIYDTQKFDLLRYLAYGKIISKKAKKIKFRKERLRLPHFKLLKEKPTALDKEFVQIRNLINKNKYEEASESYSKLFKDYNAERVREHVRANPIKLEKIKPAASVKVKELPGFSEDYHRLHELLRKDRYEEANELYSKIFKEHKVKKVKEYVSSKPIKIKDIKPIITKKIKERKIQFNPDYHELHKLLREGNYDKAKRVFEKINKEDSEEKVRRGDSNA